MKFGLFLSFPFSFPDALLLSLECDFFVFGYCYFSLCVIVFDIMFQMLFLFQGNFEVKETKNRSSMYLQHSMPLIGFWI